MKRIFPILASIMLMAQTSSGPMVPPPSGGCVGLCSPGWVQNSAFYAIGTLPAGVAFRNFGLLTASPNNPVINPGGFSWNTFDSNALNVVAANQIAGTHYSFTENGTNSTTFNTISAWTWTTDPTVVTSVAGNPIISNTASTWKDHFLLHPSEINIGGTWYVYFSAENASGVASIGCSSSPDQVTWSDCSGNPQLTGTGTGVATPSVILFGGTYYMYHSVTYPTGKTINYATSSTGLPGSWTEQGVAMPSNTGDWDASALGVFDAFVFVNNHGFCEMGYANEFSGLDIQMVGYAVSADCKTFYKYQGGPIVFGTSGVSPGDPNFVELNGTFYIFYDKPPSPYGVVAYTMTDY